MTGNYPNIDLVNMHAYIKLGEILSICFQDIEQKRNSDVNQWLYSVKNFRKMTVNNPNLDLVNINAYIKLGGSLSICSKNLEQKRYSDINQGP